MATTAEVMKATEDSIRNTLGEEYATAYSKGLSALRSDKEGDNLVRAEAATEIFAKSLGEVPSDKTSALGFAELLLAYAEALMVFVKNEEGDNAMLGPQVPKGLPVRDGIDGGVAAAEQEKGDAKEENKGKANDDGKSEEENGTKDEGDSKLADEGDVAVNNAKGGAEVEGDAVDGDKDEPGNAELVWEQLEAARMVFEAHRSECPNRLVHVYEKLGDFLMQMDKCNEAAAEYGKAAAVENETVGMESRLLALLCHSQYLALRRDDQVEALKVLKVAIDVFGRHIKKKENDKGEEAVKDDKDVLKEMEEECKAFEAAVKETVLSLTNGASVSHGATKAEPQTKVEDAKAKEESTGEGSRNLHESDEITPVCTNSKAENKRNSDEKSSPGVVRVEPRRKKKGNVVENGVASVEKKVDSDALQKRSASDFENKGEALAPDKKLKGAES